MPETHATAVERVGTEWEATCACGWEATGFEDRDAAEVAGDEHRHAEGGATDGDA